MGRDSLIGIATQYVLDDPGIRSRWRGEIFCARQKTVPGPPPPSLLYIWYRVFPGGKAARAWRWPPTPSISEFKERVELYLYSPSGPAWPVIGWWPLPLYIYIYIYIYISYRQICSRLMRYHKRWDFRYLSLKHRFSTLSIDRTRSRMLKYFFSIIA